MTEQASAPNKNIAKTRQCYLAFVLACALFPGPQTDIAMADTSPNVVDIGVDEPRAFLFVGNSYMYYNNSMHQAFLSIAQYADPDNRESYRATSATVSGAGLNWHDMESYFRPDGLAEYSFIAGNEVQFNSFEKLFDVVIMMDCSQCPINPRLRDRFHEYAARHSDTIVQNDARPALFMTWAYADKPGMTAELVEQYTIAGNKNNALVIPAGLAFASAINKRPELALHQPDNSHPSVAGTYLAALTCYAAVFRKPPTVAWAPDGISDEIAKFLQAVAWETVQNYYGD